MQTITIDKVMNIAEKMSLDDQQIFIDIFQKRFSERRREEIALNRKITINAINNNEAKIGSIQDFLIDVESD